MTTITLAEPGLRQALAASAIAITVTAQTNRNMYFARSAIALATRAPAMPEEGDQADDVMEIVDPINAEGVAKKPKTKAEKKAREKAEAEAAAAAKVQGDGAAPWNK